MTEKSTVIKLRQAESRDVTTNGSYSISLQEGIILEEGDIVKVHSVFLDTTTESLVEIVEDTLITMEIAKYWLQTRQPTKPPTNRWTNNPAYTAGPPLVGIPQPDINRYWVCAEYPKGVNDFLITGVFVGPLKHGAKYGDFVLNYEYPEVGTRTIIKKQRYIGQYHTRSHPHGVVIPFAQMMDAGPSNEPLGQVRCTNTNLGDSSINVAPIGASQWTFTGPHTGGDSIASLFTEEITFTIPVGRYQPSEIAKIITDNMSKLDAQGPIGNNYNAVPPQFQTTNPFLSSVAQQHYKISQIPLDAGTADMIMIPEITYEFPEVKTSIKFVISNVSTVDFIIGANQTSMNFDPVLKKLNFDILHMPQYVNEGGTLTTRLPGVSWTNGIKEANGTQPQVQGRAREVGTNSGIAFTRLEPIAFWETLGFTDCLLNYENSLVPLALDGGASLMPINVTSRDGVNTTNAFFGTDSIISKQGDWAFLSGPGMPPSSVTTDTQPIVSSREFENVIGDEGYLLVEVGVNFPQQMIGGALTGSTGSKSVQSIVGRYFQQGGNFLQDTGQGSIVYEHVGLPQMINDLDVRIVHPDGAPPEANELGVSNSVFLEIIKTSQPPTNQK